jgi:type VI secretion system FHA domain protein
MEREALARFSEAGGTIGRAETSTLALPDPDRYISRTHATISYQAGGFVITDNSTKNPIILNGRPMGPGSQSRLSDGDELSIGGYALAVAVATPTRAPALSSAEIWPPSAVPSTPQSGAPAARAAKSDDPFAVLWEPSPIEPGPQSNQGLAGAPSVTQPPSSLDPLVGLRGREPSVDTMLGLRSSDSPDLPKSEPPRDHSLSQPGGAPSVDPLDLLSGVARRIPPPSVPDHGQEVFTSFVPPIAKSDPPVQNIPIETLPPVTPAAVPQIELQAPVGRADITVPKSEQTGLLQSFLKGAGIPDAQLQGPLTPEAMETIGKLFREAVQGTLDLLRVRGIMKSEMRADVTMIMPLDNNPLKFSPTVETALLHLLSPQLKGFAPPVRAMREAYDDLRAHQLAFLAGMRAALEDVLARFEPEQLRRRLSDATVLDSVLPMNRRAKQWDLFVERYGEVANDARENFNVSFGSAFRRAYDAQVNQLRSERPRGQ